MFGQARLVRPLLPGSSVRDALDGTGGSHQTVSGAASRSREFRSPLPWAPWGLRHQWVATRGFVPAPRV